MPRYFLKRLKIEGFRGVNNQGNPLDIGFKPDAVNSVFAVNGIGKSSIFESLYYAIHGTIPKLDDLKAHERPQDYYCNRFHSGNQAMIELELQPDDGGDVVEPLHVFRRLQLLSKVEHHEQDNEQVFPRSARTCGAPGSR